jgi:hypothetical protein
MPRTSHNTTYYDTIIGGMAAMLWALAWADHADEHRCENLSGMDIMKVMPAVPDESVTVANDLVKGIEKANNTPLDVIFAVACNADGIQPSEKVAEKFGGDLAHMAIGSGVSWFDDHEKFPLAMPYGENYVLREYADVHCEE